MNQLAFFRVVDNQKRIEWFKTSNDGLTEKKEIKNISDLPFKVDSSVSLKDYVKFTNDIGFFISNFSTSDHPDSSEKSCYDWEVNIRYGIARQQLARKNIT